MKLDFVFEMQQSFTVG